MKEQYLRSLYAADFDHALDHQREIEREHRDFARAQDKQSRRKSVKHSVWVNADIDMTLKTLVKKYGSQSIVINTAIKTLADKVGII